MRKNIVKIRALAFALGAATIFSVTGPAFGGRGFQVERLGTVLGVPEPSPIVPLKKSPLF